MGLPAAGRAHARDERPDRTDVCSSIGINVNVIQKLFERPNRSLSDSSDRLNYGASLIDLRRNAEAKALMRKTIPVARRVLGDSNDTTLRLRKTYAKAFYKDDGATLDDLREAVETLEDTERIVRRVFGPAHPSAVQIERELQAARAALQAATLEQEK